MNCCTAQTINLLDVSSQQLPFHASIWSSIVNLLAHWDDILDGKLCVPIWKTIQLRYFKCFKWMRNHFLIKQNTNHENNG